MKKTCKSFSVIFPSFGIPVTYSEVFDRSTMPDEETDEEPADDEEEDDADGEEEGCTPDDGDVDGVAPAAVFATAGLSSSSSSASGLFSLLNIFSATGS
ncbi:hypothetical protein FACS189472_14610 [Alphaproteobacteria bacterium]|nr:hypothetical protein FACS189472_14610 [Alphaproteobacteria bacterium]